MTTKPNRTKQTKSSTVNKICVWDCTLPDDKHTKDSIMAWCNEWCKKWCFQKEKGESGFIHYQLRCSLKVAVRNMTKHLVPCHWSPTSDENRDNLFYVCKDDTKLEGPWSDKDEITYIPRQVREMQDKLYPWQETARDISNVYNDRVINCILDTSGNNGKSMFSLYMVTHGLGELLPYCNNFKDIMRMAYDLPTSKCYIIDIPRAINKKDLKGMFSGIEQLKNGYLFDDRYNFKRKFIDSPRIWVFVNKLPKVKYLSSDRWNYYKISNCKQLYKFTPQPQDYAGKGALKALRCNTIAPPPQIKQYYNKFLSTRTNRTKVEDDIQAIINLAPKQDYEEF